MTGNKRIAPESWTEEYVRKVTDQLNRPRARTGTASKTTHELEWELDLREERIAVLTKIVLLLCEALQAGAEQWYDQSALERIKQIEELMLSRVKSKHSQGDGQ